MPLPDPVARLLAAFDARKPAALARAVSQVENQREGFERLLSVLHPRMGRRRTGYGSPGAGKSTLTTRRVTEYRAMGLQVGIIAVTPPLFTGGALLRSHSHGVGRADPGVFIRRWPRVFPGGMSASTRAVADVLMPSI